MKSWFKKPIHIAIITLIGIVFFSVIIPLIINGLYQLDGPVITQWGCSDTLLFYGAALGASGTIVLGIVSVYQNMKAQELNERVESSNKALQQLSQAEFVSFVSLEKCDINIRSSETPNYYSKSMEIDEIIDLTDERLKKNKSIDCFHVDCSIKNTSKYAIVQIDHWANAVAQLHGLVSVAERAIYISPQSTTNIRIIVPKVVFDSLKQDGFYIQLDFTNVFDYSCIGVIYVNNINSPSPDVKFRLAKITDVKPKEDTTNGQT